MNVVFLTLARIADIKERGIYHDLMRHFRDEGHQVYIVCPVERRLGLATSLGEIDGVKILNVKTLNIQKANVIEKGIGTLLIESQYKSAIKKYLSDVKFDLILYSTPPITFTKLITCLKRKNPQAMTYLLLKDIFPQNAVDIGMMGQSGVRGVLYNFFRKKEKKLYALSDYIGCMSPANVEYVIRHNSEVEAAKVEVAPNSIELMANVFVDTAERDLVRRKYGLPINKPVFIYGGNLGKPQGIPFLIECLNANAKREDCHFVVVGSGTEYPRLESWYHNHAHFNISLMKGLPKGDYDQLVRACDVGLIFLDHRFTIPNFPSRLLSYLENRMPVLCATDPNTDMGRIAEDNGFGFWCESNSVEAFTAIVIKMILADRKTMGEKGFAFLKENYLVEHTYNAIVSHFEMK